MEYGIFVIKPDGVEKDIFTQVEKELKNNGLDIIEIKQLHIKESDVPYLFNSGNDKVTYAKYITSGDIIVGLVHGYCANNILKNIKYRIRNKYAAADTMKNLIHSCEPGNEYYRQLTFFFSERNIDRYSLYADMNVKLDLSNKESMLNQITNIFCSTNLFWIGAIVDYGFEIESMNLSENEQKYISSKVLFGVRKVFVYNSIKVAVIGYMPPNIIITKGMYSPNINDIKSYNEWIRDLGGVSVIDYIDPGSFRKEVAFDMARIGINGFLIFDPRYDFEQINIVEHWAVIKNSMLYSAGTNGITKPGYIGLDQYSFQKILQHMRGYMDGCFYSKESVK